MIWRTGTQDRSCMLSVVIATRESERTLVPTLSALVPGVIAGLLTDVVVADASSRDATAEIAELAGCRILASSGPLGTRLKAAAATTKTPWLMFLRAGCVLETGWIGAAERFMQTTDLTEGAKRAAVFRPPGVADMMRPGLAELVSLVRVAFGGVKPDQGLLIARRYYETIHGHPAGENAEAALLRRLGRRRIAMLSPGAFAPA